MFDVSYIFGNTLLFYIYRFCQFKIMQININDLLNLVGLFITVSTSNFGLILYDIGSNLHM